MIITDTFMVKGPELNNKTFAYLLGKRYGVENVPNFFPGISESLRNYINATIFSDLKWCYSITDNDTIQSAILKIYYQDTSTHVVQYYRNILAAYGNYTIILILEAATRGILQKRLFLKFRNIHRKTPVLVALFNKVIKFLEKHLQTAASLIPFFF